MDEMGVPMRERRVTHWKNLKKLPTDAARKTIESSPRRQKASLQSTKVLRREPSWAGEDSSSFVTELKDREAFFFRSAVGSKAKNLCRGSKMLRCVLETTPEKGNMRRVLADQLTETVVAILARALGAARRNRRRSEGRRREAAALCALAREAVVGVHLGAVDVEMLKNICAPILPVGHRADERGIGRISAHVTGGRGCGQPGGLLPVLTPGKWVAE